MRFRAQLSLDGVAVLNTEVLPALEKFGKACQLVLMPSLVAFVQDPVNTDGAQVVWRLPVDMLFEPDSYMLNSKNNDTIAFAFDLPLLKNVIRNAGGDNVASVEVKLVNRMVDVGAGATQPHPFLTIIAKGTDLKLKHQLPISAPFAPADVGRILEKVEFTSQCDYHLDIHSLILRVSQLTEKLKNIGDSLRLTTMPSGDLHLQVTGIGVFVGAEFRKLKVFPEDKAEAADPSTGGMTPEQRLDNAIEKGKAQSVDISQKQLARGVTAGLVPHPMQVLCGIGANDGLLHFKFGFENMMADGRLDEHKTFRFTLPILETEDC
ncbi:hypothetical protein BSKO_08732 [Bryopsis sp. KO-2023]|nr:hypothetical protein BSKO_08732 [Bryopsis sp. KO-2023]